MNARRRSSRRPVLDTLERRWVPSGLCTQPAAVVSTLTTTAAPVLNGTLRGTIKIVSVQAQSVKLTLSGKLSKQQVSINNTFRASTLQTLGSSLPLVLKVTKNGKTAKLNVAATVSQAGGGVLNYTITGGTKSLSGATGSGTITAVLPKGIPSAGKLSVPITLTFTANS